MKCYYCGAPVTEEEYQARYNEFLEQGIIPMMMPSHKACREPQPIDQARQLVSEALEIIQEIKRK